MALRARAFASRPPCRRVNERARQSCLLDHIIPKARRRRVELELVCTGGRIGNLAQG